MRPHTRFPEVRLNQNGPGHFFLIVSHLFIIIMLIIYAKDTTLLKFVSALKMKNNGNTHNNMPGVGGGQDIVIAVCPL